MVIESHQLPSNRSFGIFFTIMFCLVAAYAVNQEMWDLAGIAGMLGAVLAIISLLKPQWLHPLNRLWMALGLLMSRIVNPIVMGAIFFLLFVPAALLMRTFGRDMLRLKTKKKSSYWVTRETAVLPHSFCYQF